jgi:ADP-ribose pyrophosphatase YjhB (NUDIX family)
VTEYAQPTGKVAVGLITAAHGRVLLQLRDNKPEIPGPNTWGFFGGHVEAGESPEEGFLRELQEELSWRPRHFELFLSRDVDWGKGVVTSYAYAAHLDVPVEDLVLGEGQAMGLFEPAALPEGMQSGARDVVEQYAATDVYERMQRRWDHISSTGILVDPDGRFILQHRDDKPDIVNPGLWGSFGGVVEPYETPEAGFRREIKEELELEFGDVTPYGVYAYTPKNAAGEMLIYVFAARVDAPVESLVLHEGQGVGAFALDELPEKTVPDYARLLRRFASQRS